jgi:Resolvase, N terminal domain
MAKVIQKQTIFAYLRQSTVNKQEVSIENQYDDISDIAERENYILEDILDYKEKRSAWERWDKKPRKEFTQMLADIDTLKSPCILLARNSSRLARNMEDGLDIIYRIKGIHGYKRIIEKIVFADRKECWDYDTRQWYMQDEFSKNFNESEQTSNGVKDGHRKCIKAQAYPYGRDNLPKWLTLIRKQGRNYITPTSDFEYIVDAFKMRAEGITHKEISKYLSLHNINIGEKKIQGTLFSSTLYIWIFTQKNINKKFPMKSFQGWELRLDPLIPIKLWESVQLKAWTKHTTHGEKFKDDHLPVKTESGLTMSKALVKWKFPYYNNSAEKINIAEWRVIRWYLEYMKVIFLKKRWLLQSLVQKEYENEKERLLKELKKLGISINFTGKDKDIEFSRSGVCLDEESAKEYIRNFLLNEATYELTLSKNWKSFEAQKAEKYIDYKWTSMIQADIEENLEERLGNLRKARKNAVRDLENALEENGKARKRAIYLFTRDEMQKEEYNMALEMIDLEEIRIKNEISDLKKWNELDIYLEKIPSLLLKILELLGSVLYKEKVSELDEEIKALIKMTTLELIVNNKKELKIKLFDTLQNIFLRESLSGAQEETWTLTPYGNGF